MRGQGSSQDKAPNAVMGASRTKQVLDVEEQWNFLRSAVAVKMGMRRWKLVLARGGEGKAKDQLQILVNAMNLSFPWQMEGEMGVPVNMY